MFSLILNMNIQFFIVIVYLIVIFFLARTAAKWPIEDINIKFTLVLICLTFTFTFVAYKLYNSFSYETNSAKEEAVKDYIQTIENKIDPRFKDIIKERFDSTPNTFGFNLCYENNYTGETCLNYLKYLENSIKDEVEKAREVLLKSREINNNINDEFNKGEENESRN